MKRGFTIIELLIVIAVMAILIGIALPRFKGLQDEGDITKAKGELRTLQTAVESYYIHNSRTYPTALANLTQAATRPKIVTTLPTDPFNSTNNYGYAQSSNANYYVIYSVGSLGNGSATVADNGTITEVEGSTCIFVSNSERDTQP